MRQPHDLTNTCEVEEKIKEMLQEKVNVKEIVPKNRKEVALHFNDAEGANNALQIIKQLMLEEELVIKII